MTGYGLDGPGIESRCGRDFPHLYRPALGPTQPPVQWVPGLSRGKERCRCSLKRRAIPLLLLWVVRPVQSLRACTRVTFTFTSRILAVFSTHPTCCVLPLSTAFISYLNCNVLLSCEHFLPNPYQLHSISFSSTLSVLFQKQYYLVYGLRITAGPPCNATTKFPH